MTDHDRWAFDDLQVRIDRDSDGSYRTVATAPDGRTARGVFQIPVTDDELDVFVRRVGLVRGRRGPAEEQMGAIKELGSSLFDALFTDQVGTIYTAARSAAADGERRLRITLRLSGAPELMRLPWEFLYHRPRFIAQSTDTPVVRTLDVVSGRRPQKVTLPLRILGINSRPGGYSHLDAESERRNLETALEPLKRAGLVELSWLARATLSDLEDRVSEPDEIHVIHYIGHGAYSEETESGILVLETPEGRAHDVTGDEIGSMLQDESSLRLVILNSCDGARTSHIDPFSGVATSLIEFDIPAVVGMQFEITDDAAIAFSARLYKGLAQGMPIDAAVGPARRAIMAMTAAEFGTPVLFLRDGEARLFDIDDAQPVKEPPVKEPPVKEPPVKEPEFGEPPVKESTGATLLVGPGHDDEPLGKTHPRLWITAYVLAVVGAAGSLGFAAADDLGWLDWIWVVGFGLAGIFGSIASRVSAVRHRRLGTLLPLCAFPLVFVPALFQLRLYTEGAVVLFALLLSGIQILLVWTAQRVTARSVKRPSDATRHEA